MLLFELECFKPKYVSSCWNLLEEMLILITDFNSTYFKSFQQSTKKYTFPHICSWFYILKHASSSTYVQKHISNAKVAYSCYIMKH